MSVATDGPVTEFTADALAWHPYLTPIDYERATPEQRAALSETPSNTKISDYVLVLAHDPESLAARTPLFNGIMYARGGLSRAERELGATEASIVNHCLYCASVHAARYITLAKKPAVIARVFAGEGDALDAREQAIVAFSEKLSACPPAVTAADAAALREQGLSDGEIFDLVLSVALFGWANRLMHTLGEAHRPG